MNKSMILYVKISWVLGVLSFVLKDILPDELIFFLIVILVPINLIVTICFILFFAVMLFVFPEKKEDFVKTQMLLCCNFPVIFLLGIIIFYSIFKY